MKLILISPSEKKEDEIPLLLNMFEQGLPAYHLRKTKFSTRQLKSFIAEIPEKYHPRIVIHTHHELALKFNLKGIYISRSHKKRKFMLWLKLKWLKFKKEKLQVSSTYRSIEAILHIEREYDYIFLTPTFDSHSGNFQAGFTHHNLKYALQNTRSKVIARGGVSVNNIEKAKELGFSGVAFYSSIWKAKKPIEEFIKVKEKFAELGLPME